MSILIKGMEMPKDGELLCINIYPNGKVCIDMDLKCKQIATAVSVPPHGRLIDADALRDKWIWGDTDRLGYTECVEVIDIDNAPTIIEAEVNDG